MKITSLVDFDQVDLVKTVAKLTPWFAPIPSAYFVARSGIQHLDLPLSVAVIAAVIVEFLGLTSVHTWLWLTDWNYSKRKSDPEAPANFALILGVIYFAATIGLTVFLEVLPDLATYAPALFPFLAIVGAFNLVLIAQQENREAITRVEREERKAERLAERSEHRSDLWSGRRSTSVQENNQTVTPNISSEQPDMFSLGNLNRANQVRKTSRLDTLNALVEFYKQRPGASYSLAGQAVGRSKSWVSDAVNELESAGRLMRGTQGIEAIAEVINHK